MAEYVRITDVSPRDGLQNEPGVIPTAEKVRLVELLCATGVDEVEVTSFVSPKWVPQLGDGGEVFQALAPLIAKNWRRFKPVLSVLVPNRIGMDSMLSTDQALVGRVQGLLNENEQIEFGNWIGRGYLMPKYAVFTAASETFSRKNTNASIAETIARFRELMSKAPSQRVRGYISCAIACPFEGPIHPRQVASVGKQLAELGVSEIDLGDTIGAGDAASVTHLIEVIKQELPTRYLEDYGLTLHFHDTFGRAKECVQAALALGVRSFDGSVAGLGGCPYASTPGKRAPGNISTETLVRTVHAAGYETGVDLDKLAEAAAYAREMVARSRAGGTT